MKYTSDGKYTVMCRKRVIARSFIGDNGYEVRILQGMPKMETIAKIIRDCPDFAKANKMDLNCVPLLFSDK